MQSQATHSLSLNSSAESPMDPAQAGLVPSDRLDTLDCWHQAMVRDRACWTGRQLWVFAESLPGGTVLSLLHSLKSPTRGVKGSEAGPEWGVNRAHGCLTSSPQPARAAYSAAALQPGLEAAGEAGALQSPQKLNRLQGWPCLLLLGAEWTDSHLTWEGSVPQPERSVRWGSHSCLSILAGDTLSPWPHLHQLTTGSRGWETEEGVLLPRKSTEQRISQQLSDKPLPYSGPNSAQL